MDCKAMGLLASNHKKVGTLSFQFFSTGNIISIQGKMRLLMLYLYKGNGSCGKQKTVEGNFI